MVCFQSVYTLRTVDVEFVSPKYNQNHSLFSSSSFTHKKKKRKTLNNEEINTLIFNVVGSQQRVNYRIWLFSKTESAIFSHWILWNIRRKCKCIFCFLFFWIDRQVRWMYCIRIALLLHTKQTNWIEMKWNNERSTIIMQWTSENVWFSTFALNKHFLS